MTKKQAGPIREAGDACLYGVRALKCAAGVPDECAWTPIGKSEVEHRLLPVCEHLHTPSHGEMWRASERNEEEMIKYEAEKKSFIFKMHSDTLSPQRSSH